MVITSHVRRLRSHFTDTIELAPRPSRNFRGVYGQAGPYIAKPALVQWRHKLIEFESGEAALSIAKVFIEGTPDDVSLEDMIRLPTSEERKVLTIATWSRAGFLQIEV